MIVTDQFVVINFPKTGSSFVRAVLKELYGFDRPYAKILRKLGIPINTGMLELQQPVLVRRTTRFRRNQHGTYSQIPEEYRNKTIVSVVRNPFSRYVSIYLFGDWREKYPRFYQKQIQELYPEYPDLSFSEWYDMVHNFAQDYRLQTIKPKIEMGVATIQFVQFFFKEPAEALLKIDNEYIEQDKYRDDVADIVFLHQDNLNEELYRFLLQVGYPLERVSFILKADRVNVSPRTRAQQDLGRFYTPELVKTIFQRDRLLFKMLPEYDRSPISGA